MLAAPTWYRWRWSTTLPGMGQRGRPGAVAVSAKVSCRLDRWMCLGGRTITETVPVYREWTRDRATWKTHYPDPINRAVIPLGGDDQVNLTKERLANTNTPRRHCHTLITNPIILRQQAIIIARLILSLRGLLLQYVPHVFTCTLIPRDVAINFDHPVTIINDHLRASLKFITAPRNINTKNEQYA